MGDCCCGNDDEGMMMTHRCDVYQDRWRLLAICDCFYGDGEEMEMEMVH